MIRAAGSIHAAVYHMAPTWHPLLGLASLARGHLASSATMLRRARVCHLTSRVQHGRRVGAS